MSDNRPQQEPSMEEILASIRRIISDDGEEKKDEAGDGAEAVAEPEVAAEPFDSLVEEPSAEPVAIEEPEDVDDVLELTDIIEEPVEELVDPQPIDETLALEAPDADPDPLEFVPPESPSSDPFDEDTVMSAIDPVSPPFDGASDIDRLLGDEPTAAASASIDRLLDTVNTPPPIPASFGGLGIGDGRTVEDLVREMLRPMLKEWLDENLPPMVEEVVEREIRQLVQRD